MKIKFLLVNTDKSIDVETFYFEANTIEECKKQISNRNS
jgi:hypothetical protein